MSIAAIEFAFHHTKNVMKWEYFESSFSQVKFTAEFKLRLLEKQWLSFDTLGYFCLKWASENSHLCMFSYVNPFNQEFQGSIIKNDTKWINGSLNVDLAESDVALVPVPLVKNHFSLLVISNMSFWLQSIATVKVFILDSKSDLLNIESTCLHIEAKLEHIANELGLQPQLKPEIELVATQQQQGNNDCGVFVLYYLNQIIEKITAEQEDIDTVMRNIALVDIDSFRSELYNEMVYLNSFEFDE